ncbi:MAG: SprT-like domain-containing protein [Deltaproteobacteria bacterium]|nr:SprT-like domain-containing protein [Deltaproteobacteria bacterium]
MNLPEIEAKLREELARLTRRWRLAPPPVLVLNPRLRTAAGCCRARVARGGALEQEIHLNPRFVTSMPWEDVLGVLRHEAAHAIANQQAGRSAGHGPLWKQILAEVEGHPRAAAGDWLPPERWEYRCSCGNAFRRRQRAGRRFLGRRKCRACGRNLLAWEVVDLLATADPGPDPGRED